MANTWHSVQLPTKGVWLAVVAVFVLGGCMPPPPKKDTSPPVSVEKGDITVSVIETGSLQAVKSVEVKSRVSGRVKHLYVDEGDTVTAGQLIAEIDPQETELQVEQNSAQVSGAEAAAQAQAIQIQQRAVTARNALEKSKSNLRQLQMELKIQPDLTKSAVISANSGVAAAQQAYDQLVNVTQPNNRVAADIGLRDAQNNLSNGRNELNRQSNLLEKGYVSRRDVENANLQVQLAETRLRNAQETVQRLPESQRLEREQALERIKQAKADQTRTNANTIQDEVKREQYLRAVRDVSDAEAQLRDIDTLKANRRQQQFQIRQLRSVLSDGQRQLGETRILAPISGVITKRMVQIGELVSSLNSFSAGTTVFRIEDRSRMIVKLAINEIDVAKLKLATRAEITVDAFPKDTFVGRVTKISPASQSVGAPSAGGGPGDVVVKYDVEVTLDERHDKLKSGMSAKCTMKVVDKKNVLRLPLDYVGKDDKGSYVMLPPKDPKNTKDKGTRVDVEIGDQSTTKVEIVSGVKVGQKVAKPPFTGPKRQGMMSFSAGDE